MQILGNLVYGDPLMPQVSIGVQHKRKHDGPIARAFGAASDSGTDITLSATKLFLSRSVLLGVTLRSTATNGGGLLGFGSASGKGRSLQVEGSAGYQLSRRAVVGAEFGANPTTSV